MNQVPPVPCLLVHSDFPPFSAGEWRDFLESAASLLRNGRALCCLVEARGEPGPNDSCRSAGEIISLLSQCHIEGTLLGTAIVGHGPLCLGFSRMIELLMPREHAVFVTDSIEEGRDWLSRYEIRQEIRVHIAPDEFGLRHGGNPG